MFYDTLLTQSLDEVNTSYGELAEALKYPADYSSVSYRLHPEARWHDGKPVTVEDVIFSFNILKSQSPMFNFYYQHVTKAEKTGDREVTFTFDAPGNRELPGIVGQLYVLPKHWWKRPIEGKKRDITATTSEPARLCAYKIKSFELGRRVVYEREGHWGRNLPASIGDTDELRMNISAISPWRWKPSRAISTTGKSSRVPTKTPTISAINEKRVLREEFARDNLGVMQGYAFNTRRDKFKDPRVRRAFSRLRFRGGNGNLIPNTSASGALRHELASSGVPTGLELKFKPFATRCRRVFTTATPTHQWLRKRCATTCEAIRLLREAGYGSAISAW
jgi:microcin C transport system substrate-binding protein